MLRTRPFVVAKTLELLAAKSVRINPTLWLGAPISPGMGDRVQSDHEAKLELKLLSNRYDKCCKIES